MQPADYQYALLALLPFGDALWAREPDSDVGKLMAGLAEEFARIHARSALLLTESLPSKTDALLPEWEIDYGLPDGCVFGEQTLSERKAALQQKYKIYGSQSREFLQEQAAALGVDIEVTEYRHRRFGDPFGQPWYGMSWNFVIQIDAELIDEEDAVLMTRLECVISKLVHLHKVLIFNYSVRLTEGGSYRITESGAYRITG